MTATNSSLSRYDFDEYYTGIQVSETKWQHLLKDAEQEQLQVQQMLKKYIHEEGIIYIIFQMLQYTQHIRLQLFSEFLQSEIRTTTERYPLKLFQWHNYASLLGLWNNQLEQVCQSDPNAAIKMQATLKTENCDDEEHQEIIGLSWNMAQKNKLEYGSYLSTAPGNPMVQFDASFLTVAGIVVPTAAFHESIIAKIFPLLVDSFV